MSLVTGTPVGSVTTQEDLFVDSAPSIYFQDYTANPLKNPDASGFYWGLSGTSTYGVYEIGCPSDVSFADNVTANDILCDSVGMKGTIQQRNSIDLTFTIQSFFPMSVLSRLLNGGPVSTVAPVSEFGLGTIDNTKYWHVYTPRVYDTVAGDYVWLYLHKCQFIGGWNIATPFGAPWKLTGLKLRAFADTNKPSTQQFGVVGRADLSVATP